MDLDLNEPPQNLAGHGQYRRIDKRHQLLEQVKIFFPLP
jgi:hypothetical protein